MLLPVTLRKAVPLTAVRAEPVTLPVAPPEPVPSTRRETRPWRYLPHPARLLHICQRTKAMTMPAPSHEAPGSKGALLQFIRGIVVLPPDPPDAVLLKVMCLGAVGRGREHCDTGGGGYEPRAARTTACCPGGEKAAPRAIHVAETPSRASQGAALLRTRHTGATGRYWWRRDAVDGPSCWGDCLTSERQRGAIPRDPRCHNITPFLLRDRLVDGKARQGHGTRLVAPQRSG